MKRNKFSLSHYRLLTTEMGRLVPVGCVPVLPGDTIQHETSALIRVTPLNTPVMHPVAVRLHHFFVPNRLSWPESENGGWENFITGGPDGLNSATPPTVNVTQNGNDIPHMLGAANNVAATINGMPTRAFNMIYNEFYRDQDLVPERGLASTVPPKIAWEKDYFTTARPFSQKGQEVVVPVGEKAPVTYDGLSGSEPSVTATNYNQQRVLERNLTTDHINLSGSTPNADDLPLYADLANATGVSVNDFRAAFAIQRYQEARARYGSRFTEYLRYLGITPSDARLQRPEYLGGGTARLSFSEVLQTAPYAESVGYPGIGDLWGHGIAGVRSNAYRKFFEEHGYVITCMSVRPKSIYVNGCPREFLKTTKEDYFQRELANLGQQEVLESEVYLTNDRESVFGYQDRYDEYRSHPSQVSGEFVDTLNSWHLGRTFENPPTLNQSFVECSPSYRIYQVTNEEPLWCMINHKIVARRMVPKTAKPRIL